MSTPHPRDLVGYAGHPPHPHGPGEARIAVNFVMNYEEGSEYNAHDDGFSEATFSFANTINTIDGGSHPDVWFTRRIDIAKHWVATHPAPGR